MEYVEVIYDSKEVISVIPLVVKSPIVSKKSYCKGDVGYYEIYRADGSYKTYIFFRDILNDFDREDLIVLYKIFNEKYTSTRLDFDDLMLWGYMKIMFEPNNDDAVWKNHHSQELIEWKLYDSCGVHSLMLGEVSIHILVEKKYPLPQDTLTRMLQWKLHVNYDDVKGVTARGGETTTQEVHDNNTNALPKEPLVVELEKPVRSNDVLTNDQPQMTSEPVVQPPIKVQKPPVPFPRRLRKEKRRGSTEDIFGKLEATPHQFVFHQSISSNAKVCQISERIDDLDDAINGEAQELLKNVGHDSFLSRGLEKSIDQSDLECCETTIGNEKNKFDPENSSRHIDSVNTPYPVMQGTIKHDKVENEHLYSASANEIDEKKPELKNLPQHLKYAYLHGDKYFPIIISSELSEKEKFSLLQVLERRKGAIS
ncbi:hypothetical protein Tco_1106744 [Tanacetum coccineum]